MNKRAQRILNASGYDAAAQPAIAALVTFAAQNSGMDSRNYGSAASYRQEARTVTADLHRFTNALQEARAEGVTDADVIAEAPHAFSSRLSWVSKDYLREKHGMDTDYTPRWDYCTGQYFPTEYRKAAATLLEYAARRVRGNRPPACRTPRTIAELKALNRENGGCWFEPSTMRFFGTRIEGGIISGRYFVTSEQPPNGARRFSLRSFDDQGNINTVGDFCAFRSRKEALAAIPAPASSPPAPVCVPSGSPPANLGASNAPASSAVNVPS